MSSSWLKRAAKGCVPVVSPNPPRVNWAQSVTTIEDGEVGDTGVDPLSAFDLQPARSKALVSEEERLRDTTLVIGEIKNVGDVGTLLSAGIKDNRWMVSSTKIRVN